MIWSIVTDEKSFLHKLITLFFFFKFFLSFITDIAQELHAPLNIFYWQKLMNIKVKYGL